MQEESISKSLLKLTRHSIIYGVGHVLNRAVGFLLLPIYTNFIAPEQLGVAAMTFLFLALMTIVYQIGISQAFLRYFSLADNLSDKRKIFSNAFSAIFVLSLLFSFLTFSFSDRISEFLFHSKDYQLLIHLSIGILIGDVLGQIPLITLRVEEKSVLYLFITLAQILINIAFNVLFIVYQKMGIAGIFFANFISSLTMLIFLLPICIKYFRFQIQRQEIKLLLVFGFPYMFSGLAKVLMDLSDRFILERLTDFDTVGIYNAGYKLAGIMGLIVAGFRFAWMPYSLSVAKRKDAKKIYALVTTYFILGSGWILIFFTFFLAPIIKIEIGGVTLFGKEYWAGIDIVPLIMASYLLYGLYSILIIEIYIKERSKVLPIITGIGAMANILGNLALIPILGMQGAAWTTIISYFLMVAILFYDTQRNYPIPFEFKRIAQIVVLYLIVYISGEYSFASKWWFIRLGLLSVSPLVLYFIGFFHKEELQKITSLRQKIHDRNE